MTETTQFIFVLALAAAAGGWALTKLIVGLRHWEIKHLQRRLQSEFAHDLTPAISPVLAQRPQDSLKGLLGKAPQLLRLGETLKRIWPSVTIKQFLMLSLACGVVGFIAGTWLVSSMIGGVVTGALGAYMPTLVLRFLEKRRTRLLNDQLVDALEFLARSLRAGHSFATGIQMMADELPSPISEEFRYCHERHELGISLEQSLTEMAERVNSTDFAFFVTAVMIQRQTGGDLAEILDNIGSMVRNRIRLQQHMKALTAEGRLSGYILSAFPALMFVVIFMLNREYALTLIQTQLGQIMLLCAFIMQMLGLMLIRRIVSINI